MATRWLPAVLLWVAVVAAACGAGSDEAPTPSPAGSPSVHQPGAPSVGPLPTATTSAAARGGAPPLPPSEPEPSATAPPSAVAPVVVGPTGQPGSQPTPDPATPVEAARAALAARLGVGPDAVQVVAVEAVDWPDGCLGAGGPQEACILMITPGYRVTLAVGGVQYVYHTDRGTRVRPERTRGVPPAASQ